MCAPFWTRASSGVVLLDANALIALTARDHLSHDRVMGWWTAESCEFATCPVTQGALVRFHARLDGAAGIQRAKALLRSLEAQAKHRFWAEGLPYTQVPDQGLRGHRQVTDAYLAALARVRGARLVTLDQSLAAWFPDVCWLID